MDAELLLYQIFFNDDVVMDCSYHVFGISFWHWYDYNMLLFVESRNRDIIPYLEDGAERILKSHCDLDELPIGSGYEKND